jgi:hypothetical protein
MNGTTLASGAFLTAVADQNWQIAATADLNDDGQADILKLARKMSHGLEMIATLSEPGVVHQPAIACGTDGSIWSF